jgi:hypothetical protein
MEFIIKNVKRSAADIMRQIGYHPAYFQKEGETSMVRPLMRADYPRFHLYVKEVSSQGLEVRSYTFSLHLDQKKPSYEGSTGHSGDYDGPVVENEAERIKGLLS